MSYARSGRSGGAVHIDTVTIAIVLSIALLGLVMVTSASVSIASKDTGEAFFYLERQLVLMLIGGACAVLLFCIPTRLLEKVSVALLVLAIAILALVFIPGLGHTVNGSRRWLQLAGLNFQASELARVLVLIYLASYAVRREQELRLTFGGVAQATRPAGLRGCAAACRA
jgi:cell division protein FtsW